MLRNKSWNMAKIILSGNLSLTNLYTGQSIRNLYAAGAMGLDGYLFAQDKIKSQLINSSDKFRGKMNEFLEENSKNMIFTEDLKNMIYIAEKKPDDVDLVVKMIKKFNAQNKELRFGNFVFGPVVMRMLYNLQDEETALKIFKDPELGAFFDQLISYQLLLDLLYEKKRYQDVMDTFNIIKSRQVEGGRYPRHVVVLTFAACYKQNTPESFKYSSELWKELQSVGHIAMRKAATFAAGLALAQNAPHIALEILSTIKQQNYLTVRNLKVLAFAEIGRPDDALPILRGVLEINDPSQMKHTFVEEAIVKTKEAIAKSDNKDLQSDFARIEKFLRENGHISDTTLDDILCTQIATIPDKHQNERKDRTFLAANFENRNNRYQGNRDNNSRDNRTRRPGLQDLY